MRVTCSLVGSWNEAVLISKKRQERVLKREKKKITQGGENLTS